MMDPTYSVIMTSFNYASFVGAAIESVLAQTFQDWELLIVDDRSTDGSWDVIQKYKDPRIKSFLHPVNLGACEAYNLALSKARGRYIASLDSDDLFMPCKLERQIAFFERHPEVGVCGVFISEVDDAQAPIAEATPHADWFNVRLNLNDPENWIWSNHLCHSGAVVRADLHRALGSFNSSLVFTPDWEFWLRALMAGACFAVIPEPLVAYRNHGGNITQNTASNARMSQEHARTASQLLIPWLISEGRFDLLVRLIEGAAERIAGRPSVEFAVAKELAGGTGAALAFSAALRTLNEQRAAAVEAEKWRLQLVGGQQELQSRLEAYEQQVVEQRLREAELQTSLDAAIARLEEEKAVQANTESRWILEVASVRQLEAEARVSMSAVMSQMVADKLVMAENEQAWALERTDSQQQEANALERLDAAMKQMEVQAQLVAMKDEKVAVERAAWRRLLAEARQLLSPAELIGAKMERNSTGGWLKFAREKALKLRSAMRSSILDAPNGVFVHSELSPNGTVNVLLTDSHGTRFSPENHKTLLVVHELSRSGAPRVVLYLARAIRRISGVTPLIWSPVDGDIRAEFEVEGFPVIVDSSILNYQTVGAAPRLAVSCFDSVIVTSIAAYQFVRHYGSVASHLKWWIHEEVAGFEYVTTELAPDLPLLFEHCEAIWLGSPLCFAPAGKHAADHKLFLLLYGCEDTSKPATPQPDGLTVIGVVGSVEPRKGQDIFMDAIEMLPRVQQDAVLFRVIGSAPEWCANFETALRVRATAIPHIEFIPNVPPEQLNDLYASTDVIVSASRSDPMPIAITQALMFGKPCVCSSIIGHAALLQDGRDALIFETENASHLAEKLTWLIENRQSSAVIGKNGRRVYDANFLESQFVANVEFLLNHQGS